MAESLPSDSSSLQSPEVFGKLNRETCVRVWYKLKAISGDGSLRGVDKVSFCNTLLGDHYGLFNKVEVENLTSIQKISDLSTPLLSALKRVGSPVLEAVRATLVTTKDEPGALQHSVIANTLLQCATEVHLEARKNTRSKTTNLELRSFHGDQAESDQNPLKVDVSRVESQDSGVHISKPSSGYDSRTSAIVYSEQHTVSSDVSPGAAQNPEGRSRTGKWESSAFVEELTGYLVDCMDQSDLCTFANEIIDGFVLGTRDKLKQQILDSVVQERHTLYYVARHLLAKNTLYKHIFKITDFTNSPIKMEFKEVLKSHIGRGWEQVASSMSMMNRTEIDQLVNRHSNDLYCQINEFLTHPLQFPRLPTKEETASLLVEIIEKASLPETARSVCHAFAAFLQVGVDDIRPGASSNFQAVDPWSVMNTEEDPNDEDAGTLVEENENAHATPVGIAQQRMNQVSQRTTQQPSKLQHATHEVSHQQQQPQPSIRETANVQQLVPQDRSTEQHGKPLIPTKQSQPSREHPHNRIHNQGSHLQEVQQLSKIIEVECQDELDVCESDIPDFKLTHVLEEWFRAMALVRRKDRKQAVHFAAELGYVQLLKDLLEAGHNGRAIMEGDKTPFLLACEEGHLSVVKELFSVFGATITSERDEHGRTCLHFPAVYRNGELFSFLTLDAQANVKAVSTTGVTPLSVACLVGNIRAVDKLLVTMSPPEKPQKSRMPPLHAAALGNHLEVLKHIIDKKYDYISDPNAKSQNGFTPLHIAAARGNYETVEYLVSHPSCSVNAAANDQTTPLLLAAICNHPEIAQCLLDHEAGVDYHREICKNGYHITPLGEAALGRNVEVATVLMDWGANIMYKSGGTTSVLDHACMGGSEDFVNMLISKLETTPGFADKFLEMFRSAFQMSIDFNNFKIAQIILKHLKSKLCAGSMDEVFQTLRKDNRYNQKLSKAISLYKTLVEVIQDDLPNKGSSVRHVAGRRTSVLYHIGYDDGLHWGTELMHTTLMFEDLKRQERFHATYNRVYMEATKYVLRCVTTFQEGQSYESLATQAAGMGNHLAVEFYTNSKLRSRYADPEAFVQLGHAGHPTAISMARELVSQQIIKKGFGMFGLTGEQYFAEVSKRNQEHPGSFELKYQARGNIPAASVRLSDSHGGGYGSKHTSRSYISRTLSWSVPSVVSQATKQPTGGIHQETVSSLEARNHKLSKELDVAKKELDATKVEVDASKEEIAARIQYGEKITRELRTSIEENSRLQDTIEKDEEEKKQLQTKLMVAQMKLRDKGVEYDALQIKFQKPMEYLAASSGTLHKEIKSTELQDEILLAKIEKRKIEMKVFSATPQELGECAEAENVSSTEGKISFVDIMEFKELEHTSPIEQEDLKDLCWFPFGFHKAEVGSEGGLICLANLQSRNSTKQGMDNYQYVEVPTNAVEDGDSAYIHYGITPAGPFSFPDGYKLCSMVVYLVVRGAKLKKPMILHLPHWCSVEKAQTTSSVGTHVKCCSSPHRLRDDQKLFEFSFLKEDNYLSNKTATEIMILGKNCLFADVCCEAEPEYYQAHVFKEQHLQAEPIVSELSLHNMVRRVRIVITFDSANWQKIIEEYYKPTGNWCLQTCLNHFEIKNSQLRCRITLNGEDQKKGMHWAINHVGPCSIEKVRIGRFSRNKTTCEALKREVEMQRYPPAFEYEVTQAPSPSRNSRSDLFSIDKPILELREVNPPFEFPITVINWERSGSSPGQHPGIPSSTKEQSPLQNDIHMSEESTFSSLTNQPQSRNGHSPFHCGGPSQKTIPEFLKHFKEKMLKGLISKELAVKLFNKALIPESLKKKMLEAKDDYEANSLLWQHAEVHYEYEDCICLCDIVRKEKGYPKMTRLGERMRDELLQHEMYKAND